MRHTAGKQRQSKHKTRPRKGRSPGSRRRRSLRDEAGRTATAGTTSEFDVAEETNCHGRSFIFPSILKTNKKYIILAPTGLFLKSYPEIRFV